MSKPSRRIRRPARPPTTAAAVGPSPAKFASLFLGIRRALFDGTFARAAAERVATTSASESIGSAPAAKKSVNFFATASRPSSPTK